MFSELSFFSTNKSKNILAIFMVNYKPVEQIKMYSSEIAKTAFSIVRNVFNFILHEFHGLFKEKLSSDKYCYYNKCKNKIIM